MLDRFHLRQYLTTHGVDAEILSLDMPTPTVEAAARAVGASTQQIVKSLLFMIKEEPILAIACGTDPVDRRVIAARRAVGRKRVKLADAETVLKITGYPAGAVPPFGHRQPLATLLDERVLTHQVVFAGGGEENTLVRVAPQEILRLTGAEVVDLLSPSGSVP